MYVCLGIRHYGDGKTPEEAYKSYEKRCNTTDFGLENARHPLQVHQCIFVKGEIGTVKEETVTQLVFKESIKQ
jgi:hypothetical protein